ncbi:MAG: hypothetical protein AAGE84_19505 [Cyanobacteria bacterium P01_G01_bin.39]
MPQVIPDIIAVINNAEITPPGKKVIKPIPRRRYKAIKPIKELKNILGNMAYRFSMLS